MRFTLRTLLKFVSGCAVYMAVAQSAGYLVTGGIALSLWLLWWAVRSKRRGWMWLLRVPLGIASAVGLWFLAVDFSLFVECCPGCRSMSDIGQFRVCGVPVSSYVSRSTTIVETVLVDIGRPCQHEGLERYHDMRVWGLMVCACPCHCGLYGFSDSPELYTESISERLKERVRQDPGFAQEMYRRLIVQHDYVYLWEAFMVDEMAREQLKHPSTQEALSWLQQEWRGLGKTMLGYRLGNMTHEESIEMVEEIYEAGASRVITGLEYWEDDDWRWHLSEEQKIHKRFLLYVELPEDEEGRSTVFELEATKAKARSDDPTRDFGQEYIKWDW